MNGVPTLVAGSAAVTEIKLHLPRDGLLPVLDLEEVPVSHSPLFLQRDHRVRGVFKALSYNLTCPRGVDASISLSSPQPSGTGVVYIKQEKVPS